MVGYPKLEHDLNLSNIQPYHVENRLSQMHLPLANRYLGEPDYGLVGYRKLEHNLHVGRTKFYLNPSKQKSRRKLSPKSGGLLGLFSPFIIDGANFFDTWTICRHKSGGFCLDGFTADDTARDT